MPQIDTTSDLVETLFTPAEKNRAMQFLDRDLSIAYLQNTRVASFREMISLTYDVENRESSILRHAVLTGHLEILDALIAGALNPEPLPVNSQQDSQ